MKDTTPGEFLSALFGPDEFICLTDPATFSDEPKTVSEWVDYFEAKPNGCSGKNGYYFGINPVLDQEATHADKDVTRFAHCPVELEVPKELRANMTEAEKQTANEGFYGSLLDSNLPLAAVYTSGCASVHGLVRVDAKNAQEFKERSEKVYAYCSTMPGFDKSNKNPGRLSRLPGVMRGGSKQALISWNTGAASFEDWADSVEYTLFEIEDPLEWTEDELELPPELIEGFLHKGHVGMLTGSMKTNKSWTLLELAICFAKGLKWFGRQCRESTVLYIDAEIQKPFWKKRMDHLCEKLGQDYRDVMETKRIRPAFVRGQNVTASALQAEIVRMYERGLLEGVSAIVLDPIYQFYNEEWDENGNSDMAKLGRILLSLSELTGISILFAHHHTKGNQDGKRDIEKASGGGAFGRFVASSLAITLLDEESMKFTLGWTTTNFKPSPKQVAYREDFGWRISDEDPKEAAKNHRTIDDIIGCLPDAGLSSEHWLAACREQFEITDDAFETLRPTAKKADRCFFSKSSNKWEPTAQEIENRGSGLPVSDDGQ